MDHGADGATRPLRVTTIKRRDQRKNSRRLAASPSNRRRSRDAPRHRPRTLRAGDAGEFREPAERVEELLGVLGARYARPKNIFTSTTRPKALDYLPSPYPLPKSRGMNAKNEIGLSQARQTLLNSSRPKTRNATNPWTPAPCPSVILPSSGILVLKCTTTKSFRPFRYGEARAFGSRTTVGDATSMRSARGGLICLDILIRASTRR